MSDQAETDAAKRKHPWVAPALGAVGAVTGLANGLELGGNLGHRAGQTALDAATAARDAYNRVNQHPPDTDAAAAAYHSVGNALNDAFDRQQRLKGKGALLGAALGAGALGYGGYQLGRYLTRPKSVETKMASDNISDEAAQHALNRLKDIDQKQITPGRTARYAGVGAAVSGLGNVLADTVGGRLPKPGESKGAYLRGLAGKAVAGAVTTGGVPLVQQHLDRRAEQQTLNRYLQSHSQQTKQAGIVMNMQAIEEEFQLIKQAAAAHQFDQLAASMADALIKEAALSLQQLKKPLPFGVGKLNPTSTAPIGALTKLRQTSDPVSRGLDRILSGNRTHASA